MDVQTAYENCRLCPRLCGVNRFNTTGFCGEGTELRIASAGLHFGEEPPVTGTGGSGTIFITGCTLKCSFCQNYQISAKGMGRGVSSQEFTDICLLLQKKGAENINIVTGSHAIPAIAVSLDFAKREGLTIPVFWNSSSYETPEALALLDGLVDGWLPDLKNLNPVLSGSVFRASDYPSAAKKAIRWMVSHSPLRMVSGKMVSGVIMRHLILPGRMDDSRLVLEWFRDHLRIKALLSLMTQYTPVPDARDGKEETAFQDRYINGDEFNQAQKILEDYEIDDGFYQELVQGSAWLPDFERVQPFSSSLAVPVWHWREGFLETEG